MDPRDRELLGHIAALSEKNHKMLKRMQSHMRLQRFLTFLYWIIIISTSIGVYYWLQPVLDQLMIVYHSMIGAADSLKNASSTLNSFTGH